MKSKLFISISSALCLILVLIGGWMYVGSTPDIRISPAPPASEPSSYAFLYITISLLSLSTAIAVSVSFYLYKWRRILLANPNSVVPEEWAKYLQGVGEGVTRLSSSLDANLSRISQESRYNTERISNMTETYMELQGALDEKDKEISRLKEGYDAEIFRKFIGRFARVDQALEDLIADSIKKEELLLIKRLLEDAFEECGVVRHSPNIGDDYRVVSGVSDNPKTKLTADPELDFKIAEIIEYGYELNTGFEKKSLIPSKVRIYKFKEEA